MNKVTNSKSKLHKHIITALGKMKESINKLLKNIIIDEQSFIVNKEEVKYWKNKIFYITSVIMVTFGAPIMFYGAFMFYSHGRTTYAIMEVLLYLISAIIITNKSFSIKWKKYYITYIIYLISIFLLLTTGLMGGGMVCVTFSLILAGCLLERKQIYHFVEVNLFVFFILTVLLYLGFFDGSSMGEYKEVWIINGITALGCGIMLLILMNTIYIGLEKQTMQIKKSEASLAASELKHIAMIANISDAIVIIDEKGSVSYHSPNLIQRFPWMSKDIINSSFYNEIHPLDRHYVIEIIQNLLLENGLKKTIEARYQGNDGTTGYLELTAVNLMQDSNINGILINYNDITERKIREEEIIFLSQHDSLTGLYNRAFYEIEKERLNVLDYLPLSIIIGDINGLKIINDTMGHAEGDKLLINTGKILKRCCGKDDIVARIGGDEFNILLPNTSSEEAAKLINKINAQCDDYNNEISGDLYHISISLGSATRTSINETLDHITKMAEDFMYKRKLLKGRNFHSSIISSMKMALSEKSHETEEHFNSSS